MNTYAAYHVMYGGVDPWGLNAKLQNEPDVELYDEANVKISGGNTIEVELIYTHGDDYWSDWESASSHTDKYIVGTYVLYEEDTCECVWYLVHDLVDEEVESKERKAWITRLKFDVKKPLEESQMEATLAVAGLAGTATGGVPGAAVSGGASIVSLIESQNNINVELDGKVKPTEIDGKQRQFRTKRMESARVWTESARAKVYKKENCDEGWSNKRSLWWFEKERLYRLTDGWEYSKVETLYTR